MANIATTGTLLRADGLKGWWLTLEVATEALVPAGRDLLRGISGVLDTLDSWPAEGVSGAFGSTMIRVDLVGGPELTLNELVGGDSPAFEPGVERALNCWDEQHRLCSEVGSPFLAALGDQLVAVAPAVVDGAPVEGVRYTAPPHMSGWILIPPGFTGAVDELLIEHVHHLASSRPDLLRYLGLGPGYRFDTARNDIWHDPEAAAPG